MPAAYMKRGVSYNFKVLNSWFEELCLPVAPSCNMMCNFCSKDSDCVCNGNCPDNLSRSMTPRQAVSWAVSQVNKNKRIKVIKIAGPGEPLFNFQTFEVLKRLRNELPDCIFGVCTNGLLLGERFAELKRYNVGVVEVAINSVFNLTGERLYSRMIKGQNIVVKSNELSNTLLQAQIEGIKLCMENGVEVRINTVYIPGTNDKDIFSIATLARDLGVRSMRIISTHPAGKMKGFRVPSMLELSTLQRQVSRIIHEVEIKSFVG